jgi:DNA helicase IV
VPGEVIELAARLLPRIAPDLEPPVSVRRTRGELVVRRVPTPVAELAERTVPEVLSRVGSVGVIVPDALVSAVTEALSEAPFALVGATDPESAEVEFDSRLDIVPAALAKGLEFDHVVLLEPADIVAGEPDVLTGLRRLYICLTRAVTSLTLLHEKPLPATLGSTPTGS